MFLETSTLPFVSHLLFNFLLRSHNFNISIFPIGLSQFDGSASNIFPVQFFHGPSKIGRVLETDETEPLCLVALFVSNHFCSDEGGVSTEGPNQNLVCDVITEVAAKKSKIVDVPFFQSFVLPYLSSTNTNNSLLLFCFLQRCVSDCGARWRLLSGLYSTSGS